MGVPLEKEVFGYYPDTHSYDDDQAKAKQLLAEAGHPNGLEATLRVPNHRYMNDVEVMQHIAAILGKVVTKGQVQA